MARRPALFMAKALYITGKDFGIGDTVHAFVPMGARLEAIGYDPVYATWDSHPLPSDIKVDLVVGHSFGAHEAVKFCRRAQYPVVGLVILDAVHQDTPLLAQFFSEPLEIPFQVKWPLSLRRRCFGWPYSVGFDQPEFNRIVNVNHGDFPKAPAVIEIVYTFAKGIE